MRKCLWILESDDIKRLYVPKLRTRQLSNVIRVVNLAFFEALDDGLKVAKH